MATEKKRNQVTVTLLYWVSVVIRENKNKRNQALPQFPFIYSYSAELSSHQFSTIHLLPVLVAIDVQIFRNHPLATIKPESVFLLKG